MNEKIKNDLHNPKIIRHTENMRTVIELREECASFVVSKPMACPDGVTRLVTMHPKDWEHLETILRHGERPLDCILSNFVLPHSHQAVIEEGWNFDDAFRETLMYFVHRSHQCYLQYVHNIANDDWDNRWENEG